MADSSAANKVTVSIYGEEYPITGAGDRAYISKIADYVDAKMREAAKDSRVVARDKVAILAAMSIASELHGEKQTRRSSGGQIDARIDNLLARLDKALGSLP
ncbi:MAG: cell division protein ZapA [Candidatus Zixiibacteriota bacterium]|nr:MAG: cell division protein ZapA [candidate division Zixibacteria bacterium]